MHTHTIPITTTTTTINTAVGDWLQGPYVYALYESYGYSPAQIGQLFIAGFGSSMLFGTFVGALADKAGRKAAALAYVATYSLSCCTKHSPNYWVLMVGRVLGGIATSLLYSAFESWLVAEHFKRGYSGAEVVVMMMMGVWRGGRGSKGMMQRMAAAEGGRAKTRRKYHATQHQPPTTNQPRTIITEQSLGQTFSWAVFLGNGLMAILAGFLGDALVERAGLGRVAPFDAAIVFMLLGGAVILHSWPENYGDRSSHDLAQQFSKAWGAIQSGAIKEGGEGICRGRGPRKSGGPRRANAHTQKTPTPLLFPLKHYNALTTTPQDPCIALLGAIQAMFEAAMYSFVFLWTMSMSPNKEAIKHGLIFVNFMTASMLGSFLAGVLMKRARPEAFMKGVFAVATVALLVPAVLALDTTKRPELKGKPITRSGQVQLLAFCVFEACVGVFWPTMMKLRADYVPEELRATIINIFRVPLNLFVCVVLGNVSAKEQRRGGGACAFQARYVGWVGAALIIVVALLLT